MDVEEIILSIVNMALDKEELEREYNELETGEPSCYGEGDLAIKKRMFKVVLKCLFDNSNKDDVLLSVIDSMYLKS